MAVCSVCGKMRMVGNNVSHANNKTKRAFKPNIHRVRISAGNGTTKRVYACTRCIRSGKVVKG